MMVIWLTSACICSSFCPSSVGRETKTRSANELLEQCGRAQYHPHQPIDRVRHRESLSSWNQPWAIDMIYANSCTNWSCNPIEDYIGLMNSQVLVCGCTVPCSVLRAIQKYTIEPYQVSNKQRKKDRPISSWRTTWIHWDIHFHVLSCHRHWLEDSSLRTSPYRNQIPLHISDTEIWET